MGETFKYDTPITIGPTRGFLEDNSVYMIVRFALLFYPKKGSEGKALVKALLLLHNLFVIVLPYKRKVPASFTQLYSWPNPRTSGARDTAVVVSNPSTSDWGGSASALRESARQTKASRAHICWKMACAIFSLSQN